MLRCALHASSIGSILAVYAGTEKPNQLFDIDERIGLARGAIAASSDPAANKIEIDTFRS